MDIGELNYFTIFPFVQNRKNHKVVYKLFYKALMLRLEKVIEKIIN